MNEKIGLNIILVDDEEIVHKTIASYLRDLGHRVDNARNGTAALKLIESNDYDIALIDVLMPGIDGLSLLPAIEKIRPELSSVIITGHGNMDMVIQALRLGAADFLSKPIKLLELDAVLEKSLRIRYLRRQQRHLTQTIVGLQTSEDLRIRNRRLVGNSHAMHEVREQIKLAVKADCETILITGETGTGKEVVAREIHFDGIEKDEKPFIAVSCPAIPDSLFESELFGHVKGSFTGATMDKPGYFAMADGGTLFLDEIADLSSSAQAKLLRALETRKFRKIGSAEEISVNLRVIAATNIRLEDLVESKKFRQDLFYRLNVFVINLLPLRERKSDIISLAEHFLSLYIKGKGLQVNRFSDEAKGLLLDYDFPGNARELRNIVERAAILAWSGTIQAKHLNLQKPDKTLSKIHVSAQEQDRLKVLKALEQAKWNRSKAARELGISYSSLRYKIQKYGIF